MVFIVLEGVQRKAVCKAENTYATLYIKIVIFITYELIGSSM